MHSHERRQVDVLHHSPQIIRVSVASKVPPIVISSWVRWSRCGLASRWFLDWKQACSTSRPQASISSSVYVVGIRVSRTSIECDKTATMVSKYLKDPLFERFHSNVFSNLKYFFLYICGSHNTWGRSIYGQSAPKAIPCSPRYSLLKWWRA